MAARKIIEDPGFERVNIATLLLRYPMDRATLKRRLRAAAIEPAETRAKETFYEVTPLLIATLERRVEKLDEVKLRGEMAKTELVEAKVAQIRGETIPVAEAVEIVQQLFSAMHREIAVRQPQRLAARLSKARTAAAAKSLIKNDTDKVFKTLADDWQKFLSN